MQVDILSKLQKHLLQDSFEESDIVYIFSRIRKILELRDEEEKYKKLKFFCDWSLHVKIDNVSSVSDLLKNIVENGYPTFAIYELFASELSSFLKEYELQTSIFSSDSKKNEIFKKLGRNL